MRDATITISFSLSDDGGCAGHTAPQLRRLEGQEALSALYRFEIDLAYDAEPPAPETALGTAATLCLDGGEQRRRDIRGIVAEWHPRKDPSGGWRVAATLVPRAWLLTRRRRTRGFHDLAPPDVAVAVSAELRDDGAPYARLALTRGYAPRVAIGQHAETDFDLLGRLLEDAGIAYVFDHAGAAERMVLTDSNSALAQVGGALAPGAEADAGSLVRRGRLDVAADGRVAARTTWEGEGADPRLAPGARLHHPEGPEAGLLLLSVKHWGAYDPETGAWTYGNSHAAQAFDRAFRPAPTTPRPTAQGVRSAVVADDGRGGALRHPVDGRIALLVPEETGGGSALCWAATALPDGGQPPAGARVAWSCLDGDPDRPVVIGAFADGAASRPGRQESGLGKRRVPAAFIPASEVTTIDEAPVPRHLGPPYEDHNIAGSEFAQEDTLKGTGAPDGKSFSVLVPDYDSAASDNDQAGKSTYLRLGSVNNKKSTGDNADANTPETWFYDGKHGSLELALNTKKEDFHGWFDYTDGNRTTITKGNKEEIIGNKRRLTIGGGGENVWDANPIYWLDYGPEFIAEGGPWKKIVAEQASSETYTIGDNQSASLGISWDIHGGFAGKAQVAGNLTYGAAWDVSYDYSSTIAFGKSDSFDFKDGSSYDLSTDASISAIEEVHIGVFDQSIQADARNEVKSAFVTSQAWAAAVGGVIGFAAGGVPGIVRACTSDASSATGAAVSRSLMGAMQGASMAVWASSLKKAKTYKKKIGGWKSGGKFGSELHMVEDQIIMALKNNASLVGFISMNDQGEIALNSLYSDQKLSYLKLRDNGNVEIESGNTVKIQNEKRDGMFSIKTGGQLETKATSWKINSKVFNVSDTLKLAG